MANNEYYYGPSYGIEDKQNKRFLPVCSKCYKAFKYMDTMFAKNGTFMCYDCFQDYVYNMNLDQIAEAMGIDVQAFGCDDWR